MKNKKTLIVVGIIILAVIIIALSAIGTYNSLVRLEEKAGAAYSNIDTLLQRRAELIPNLVSTVKGFNIQEQAIIDSVTAARAKLSGVSGQSAERMAAEEELSGALSRLLVVVENYPELKSDKTFIALFDELAGTGNRIAVARRDYNDAVLTFNSKTKTFPGSLFGFDSLPYFEASPNAQTVPEVNFE